MVLSFGFNPIPMTHDPVLHPRRLSAVPNGLVNLVAELEHRLIGRSSTPGLDDPSAIPEASSYVLVLFDGLGHRQLDHPAAANLRDSSHTPLEAPFPTTTTVSMATVATGHSPRTHGVIAHLMWIPALGKVVNTLKWVTPTGTPVEFDTGSLLPGPNLWERLADAGREPVTVQPGNFEGTPLSRALYRGCRFEGVYSVEDRIRATVELAARPGRLVFTYFPEVDFAAHVYGMESPEYSTALGLVDAAWERLALRLPSGAVAVGTADHGMVDVAPDDKILIRDAEYDDLVFFGDPRGVGVRGETSKIEALATEVGATVVAEPDYGEGMPHPELAQRAPDRVLLAPEGCVLLPRGFDKRMVGYHGGLDPAEVEIPLLVAGA